MGWKEDLVREVEAKEAQTKYNDERRTIQAQKGRDFMNLLFETNKNLPQKIQLKTSIGEDGFCYGLYGDLCSIKLNKDYGGIQLCNDKGNQESVIIAYHHLKKSYFGYYCRAYTEDPNDYYGCCEINTTSAELIFKNLLTKAPILTGLKITNDVDVLNYFGTRKTKIGFWEAIFG